MIPSRANSAKDILDSFYIQAVDQYYDNDKMSPVKMTSKTPREKYLPLFNLNDFKEDENSATKTKIISETGAVSADSTDGEYCDSKNSSCRSVNNFARGAIQKLKMTPILQEGWKDGVSMLKQKLANDLLINQGNKLLMSNFINDKEAMRSNFMSQSAMNMDLQFNARSKGFSQNL